MLVTVESKNSSCRPLIPEHIEHCGAVDAVEGIVGIQQKKAKVWFGCVVFPNLVCGMNSSFNARLHAYTELVHASRLGG
jgi:hypothetical protein